MARNFAVIDTETNWKNEVMSIGILTANSNDFQRKDSRYYILPKEEAIGGMYSSTMRITSHEILTGGRKEVISDLRDWLDSKNINDLFAYNASFDKNHLPELNDFRWRDIMKVAAYKQHNPHIPDYLPCCKTGRLRKGYGVEPILKMMDCENYCESHNAIMDARDELRIMEILDYELDFYPEI